MSQALASDPWYVAERNVERALDRAASGHPLVTVAGSTAVIEATERHFTSSAQIDDHVRWLAGHPAVAVLASAVGAPVVSIDPRRRHATHRHAPAGGTIHLPDSAFGRRQITVLHEYAHHLTPGHAHGPDFCGVLILLVRTAIGPAASLMLTEQYALHDVAVHLV